MTDFGPERGGQAMPEQRSSTDEDNIDQMLAEVGAQAIGSPQDALHLFYGLTSAIDQLNAGPVLADLEAEFNWFRLLNHGGALGEYAALTAPEQHDRMADFDKRAGALLQLWMGVHGLTEVTLNVYMPCHWSYTAFTIRSVGGHEQGVRGEA